MYRDCKAGPKLGETSVKLPASGPLCSPNPRDTRSGVRGLNEQTLFLWTQLLFVSGFRQESYITTPHCQSCVRDGTSVTLWRLFYSINPINLRASTYRPRSDLYRPRRSICPRARACQPLNTRGLTSRG